MQEAATFCIKCFKYNRLSLLVRGKTAKEIGAELYLSRRIVENYLATIKEKLE